LIKRLLRRCSGHSKLPKEFGSIGALLPYYLTMRNHNLFRDIFNDNNTLAEEFAKLFATSWQPPKNLINLPQNSKNDGFENNLLPLMVKSNGLLEP